MTRVNSYPDKRRDSAYNMNLSPNNARRLREFIYNGSNLYLERKQKIFEQGGEIVLSTSEMSQFFTDYDNARNEIMSLGIQTQREWHKYWKKYKRPIHVPSNPSKTYNNKGWISWGHWLGKEV